MIWKNRVKFTWLQVLLLWRGKFLFTQTREVNRLSVLVCWKPVSVTCWWRHVSTWEAIADKISRPQDRKVPQIETNWVGRRLSVFSFGGDECDINLFLRLIVIAAPLESFRIIGTWPGGGRLWLAAIAVSVERPLSASFLLLIKKILQQKVQAKSIYCVARYEWSR